MEPSILLQGYRILEVESFNGLLFCKIMDLGIGLFERHQIISKEVIMLYLFTISLSHSGPILGRGTNTL